MFRKATNMTLC